MKTLIIITAILLSQKMVVSQTIDTLYHFSPAITGKVSVVRKLDSSYRDISWKAEKDSGRQNILQVSLIKDGNLVEQGRYKLVGVDTLKKLVIQRGKEGVRKEIASLTLIYVRDGYWHLFRKGHAKEIFYFNGKVLKMKN